jgi:hypothetical protein
MSQTAGKIYICPMHPEARQALPGKCPTCGMQLLPEGTKFAMLRHIGRSPIAVVIMVAVVATLMYMVIT